jgi:hypothetical protein
MTPPNECMVCASVQKQTKSVVIIGFACSRSGHMEVLGYCQAHAYGEMEFGSQGSVWLAENNQVMCHCEGGDYHPYTEHIIEPA